MRLVRRGIDPRLYHCWAAMKARCNNPRHEAYKWYGGRGIKVCARWGIFENFETDMGPHPGLGWTLDRKCNAENYRHGNCRWTTRKVQTRNSRQVKLTLTQADAIRAIYKDNKVTQRKLANQYGVSQATISLIVTDKHWV